MAVELDGEPWRTVPLEAAVRAGLANGVELDRSRARTLGRELRRLGALDAAARALRHRDLAAHALEERLAGQGIRAPERARTLATLERAGVVDDERFAHSRADLLADRGYGDAYIRHDLEALGLGVEAIEGALDGVQDERTRVARLVERRGASAATFRYLARRGFDEEAIAFLVASESAGELG